MKRDISKDKFLHLETCAKYMRERATDYGLNPDEMYLLGLIHDVGYIEGRDGHEKSGADILKRFGAREENIFAVRWHGANAYEISKKVDKMPKEYVLLLEADLSISSTGEVVGFASRLAEIEKRYGSAIPAIKNVQFIKEYWIKNGIKPV